MGAGGSGTAEQPASAQFPEGRNLSGEGKGRLRAGAQLLFLPGRIGRLPHRLVSGGGGVFKIQLFLLCHRIPPIAGGPAGAVYLRIPLPLRMVSGAAAQDPDPEAIHQKTEAADLH